MNITLQLLIDLLVTSLCISVLAYTYSAILIQSGEALGFISTWMKKLLIPKQYLMENLEAATWLGIPVNHCEGEPKLEIKIFWIGRFIIPLWNLTYIYKAIGGCEKCLAGQLALWGYLILSKDYQPLYHLLLVAFTILVTFLMSKLIRKIND